AGVVGVVAYPRREAEGHREPRLPPLEQEVVALVGIRRAPEARELPHRPQPPAVHRLMDAAGERIPARLTQPLRQVSGQILGGIDRLFLDGHRIAPLRSCSRMSAATS